MIRTQELSSSLCVSQGSMQSQNISFSEIYIQNIHVQSVCSSERNSQKRYFFSEASSLNKIPLSVVAVEERTNSGNHNNLQPNSVRVGANCSQHPINQLSCELHDKSMRTGSWQSSV